MCQAPTAAGAGHTPRCWSSPLQRKCAPLVSGKRAPLVSGSRRSTLSFFNASVASCDVRCDDSPMSRVDRAARLIPEAWRGRPSHAGGELGRADRRW
jgi:hypothetical protein